MRDELSSSGSLLRFRLSVGISGGRANPPEETSSCNASLFKTAVNSALPGNGRTYKILLAEYNLKAVIRCLFAR